MGIFSDDGSVTSYWEQKVNMLRAKRDALAEACAGWEKSYRQLEREARYHQQELNTFIDKKRELEQKVANISRQHGEIQEALLAERNRADALTARVEAAEREAESLNIDLDDEQHLRKQAEQREQALAAYVEWLKGLATGALDDEDGDRLRALYRAALEAPTTSLARLIDQFLEHAPRLTPGELWEIDAACTMQSEFGEDVEAAVRDRLRRQAKGEYKTDLNAGDPGFPGVIDHD